MIPKTMFILSVSHCENFLPGLTGPVQRTVNSLLRAPSRHLFIFGPCPFCFTRFIVYKSGQYKLLIDFGTVPPRLWFRISGLPAIETVRTSVCQDGCKAAIGEEHCQALGIIHLNLPCAVMVTIPGPCDSEGDDALSCGLRHCLCCGYICLAN